MVGPGPIVDVCVQVAPRTSKIRASGAGGRARLLRSVREPPRSSKKKLLHSRLSDRLSHRSAFSSLSRCGRSARSCLIVSHPFCRCGHRRSYARSATIRAAGCHAPSLFVPVPAGRLTITYARSMLVTSSQRLGVPPVSPKLPTKVTLFLAAPLVPDRFSNRD